MLEHQYRYLVMPRHVRYAKDLIAPCKIEVSLRSLAARRVIYDYLVPEAPRQTRWLGKPEGFRFRGCSLWSHNQLGD
jgi:hypothetical protein